MRDNRKPDQTPNPRGTLRQHNRCVRIGGLGHPSLRESKAGRAWEAFRNDAGLKRKHKITEREIQMLSQASMMGDAKSTGDFLFLLNILRSATNR